MDACEKFENDNAERGLKIFTAYILSKNNDTKGYRYEVLGTQDKYSSYDAMVIRRSNEDYGDYTITYHEIKLRADNISYTQYPDSMLDEEKILYLQKMGRETGDKIYVEMIYPKDGMMLIWEIDPMRKYEAKMENIKWRSRSLRENKEVKCTKPIVHLPNNEALKYVLKQI